MVHFLVFGDSIGCGQNDPDGGWVKKLSQEYPLENLSVDGATTSDLLTNFPAKIDLQATIVIALGVNDSAMITLKKFKHNLIQLIKLGRKYTQKIVFVGPAPVDQLKVDLSYKNETIKQYHEAIKSICGQEKLQFIDLFNNLKSDYINCLDDGLHPNPAGHEMIFAIVREFIKIK